MRQSSPLSSEHPRRWRRATAAGRASLLLRPRGDGVGAAPGRRYRVAAHRGSRSEAGLHDDEAAAGSGACVDGCPTDRRTPSRDPTSPSTAVPLADVWPRWVSLSRVGERPAEHTRRTPALQATAPVVVSGLNHPRKPLIEHFRGDRHRLGRASHAVICRLDLVVSLGPKELRQPLSVRGLFSRVGEASCLRLPCRFPA